MNRLYYGDNLTIMQRMPKHSVDLIYLDPPFNSKRNYNIMYRNMTGLPVPEQVEAFCDTWELDAEKEQLAREMPVLMRDHGIEDYYVQFWRLWMQALRHTQPHLLAYLVYMVERLLHMRITLKPGGSIYLHCDPTVSHYIKVMMDGIFGHQNFRNEIIWQRTESHNTADRYGNIADIILYYVRPGKVTWNSIYQPYGPAQLKRFRHPDKGGRRYKLENLTAPRPDSESGKFNWRGTTPGPSRGWGYNLEQLEEWWDTGRIHTKKDGTPRMDGLKVYLDESEGKPLQNIWTDIPRIPNTSSERLGYPTQKPMKLLDRIILASSNPGDVVFDPFCGCGTTIYSADKNNREWIGCDIAILAIRLVRDILKKRHKLTEGRDFEIDGIPVSVEQALHLFKRDPFQFQHWVVERAGGFPMQKKVADRGIDGRLYFEVDKKDYRSMVLSVKGGNIRPTDIRDLRGVLEREDDAVMAGFISIKEPTRAMKNEAATAGMYTYNGIHHPRIQFLTVADMLEERREFQTPSKMGTRAGTQQGNLQLT